MNVFEKSVLDTIKRYNMIQSGDCIVVGLSGGADSASLLYCLNSMRDDLNISLIAAHLNHSIRGEEANNDMEFAREFASRLNVDFVSKTVDVPIYAKKHKISEETAGRELRYGFFNKICAKYKCNKIAVAHNMNDRAESVLLNIIRGSGSNGMVGIRAKNANVIRPLINCTRESIEQYSKECGFSYVTDSTNNEDIYARNLIRNKVLPLLKQINSASVQNIVHCSDIICSESDYIVSSIDDLNILTEIDGEIYINKAKFTSLHDAVKKSVIIRAHKILCDSTHGISSSQVDMLCVNFDTGNEFKLSNNTYAYITHEDIVITKRLYERSEYSYKIKVPGEVYVPQTNIKYTFEYANEYKKEPDTTYISADDIDIEKLVLRTRLDGDAFTPSGLNGRQKVKKFFINQKIPQYKRCCYPLLATDEDIIAIVPLRVSDKNIVTPTTRKILKINVYKDNKA